jgi:predicted PurR-regulated permease PerM
LRDSQTNELLTEFRNVTIGALLGNIINGITQGLIIFLGFFVAGIPHAAFFGIITIFTSLIPLVGSQLVWLPGAIALGMQDRVAAGIGLGVWCTVMVLIVDNGIKPRVLRGKVEFHGGLLLLGFIGGLGVFGLAGLIAGPLVVAFALTLFRIYQRDHLNCGVVMSQRLG